jgi:hypothetical protein
MVFGLIGGKRFTYVVPPIIPLGDLLLERDVRKGSLPSQWVGIRLLGLVGGCIPRMNWNSYHQLPLLAILQRITEPPVPLVDVLLELVRLHQLVLHRHDHIGHHAIGEIHHPPNASASESSSESSSVRSNRHLREGVNEVRSKSTAPRERINEGRSDALPHGEGVFEVIRLEEGIGHGLPGAARGEAVGDVRHVESWKEVC